MIDSMLFVFGYRAQKIRSKKLSVLIHSSDKHKDVESCTVEVHFQKIIDKVHICVCVYVHAQSHYSYYKTTMSNLRLGGVFYSFSFLKNIFPLFFTIYLFAARGPILVHNSHTCGKTQLKILL